MVSAEATSVRTRSDRFAGIRSARARVFFGSALVLFLELVLIRELGAKVVHLSYFTNFVLLGSFLGVGLGFLASGKRRDLAWLSPPTLAVLLAFVTLVPVEIDRRSDQVIYFTAVNPSGPPTWVVLPLVFAAVAVCVFGPAQLVGRSFRELAPLDAYRLDLLGSLAGIVAFTGLALLGAPPLVWGLVLVALFIALLGTARAVTFSCALLIALFVADLPSGKVMWSPYYRIIAQAVRRRRRRDRAQRPGQRRPASGREKGRGAAARRSAVRHPVSADRGRLRPATCSSSAQGRGTTSLSRSHVERRHVDAVEIDPKILELGRQRHPDRPYEDPRVTTHVDDGRAFLERTNARYDLVLFALPDSLALVTGGGAIRLESYLFTREAMAAVRRHLTERGGFAMYNLYREQWLVDRFAGTVASAFGHEPCVDEVQRASGQAVISVAVVEADQRCGAPFRYTARVAPATDDRRSRTSAAASSRRCTCSRSLRFCWRASSPCGSSPGRSER